MLPRRHLLTGILCMVVGSGFAIAQPVPLPPGSQSSAPGADNSALPNMGCGQQYSPQWDNCVGLVRYPNGNVYQGEFHNGQREGFGLIAINAMGVSDQNNILSKEPSIYAGQFQGGRLNGHGVWFTRGGAGYSGTFVNNIPQPDVAQKNCSGPPPSWNDCVAAVRYGNGNLYRGEFTHGQREGIGMLVIMPTGTSDAQSIRMPVTPAIYVGEFKGDRLNGKGMVFMPGAGFYGSFRDNVFISGSATTQLTAPSVPTRTALAAYPPITFSGEQFILYKTEPINNGWAAYYSIDQEHPNSATDTIVIDRLNPRDSQGRELGPAQYERDMLNDVKSRGAKLVFPFAVPDHDHPGQYTYYTSFYYIYPGRSSLGDIWLSRTFIGDMGTVGILYRHTISGSDPKSLEDTVKHWMAMNLKSHGDALGSLTLPMQPSELPNTSP